MLTLNNLYEMVEKFNSQLTKTTKLKSNCKSGCSRCCYVDLSVFSTETNNIQEWFNTLSLESKSNLRNKWKDRLRTTLNFNNIKTNSCVFLHEEKCTIYQARPLICRTQGLALMFTGQNSNKKYVDICPLNEEILEDIAKSEILNLDLINSLLQNINGEEKLDRIPLSQLRQKLMNENN